MKMEIFSVRTPARVRLTAKADCEKCDGRGIRLFSEHSDFIGKMEISVKLCPCVKPQFIGKPRLPKSTMNAQMIGSVEIPSEVSGK